MKKVRLLQTVGMVTAFLLASFHGAVCSVYAEEQPELSDAEQVIMQLIEEYKAQTPAVSVTVFEGQKDICAVAYGEADKEAHVAADAETVYEWGSISKMLVWVSAMQLYEQGRLDLQADIKTYLPEEFSKKLFYKHPITMLNLMNHDAGFQDAMWPLETDELSELKPLDVALLDTQPAQVCEPGTTVAYSNWGAALAGYVVECISGMPYADYVQQNIFAPLHMEHSYIRPDVSDNAWAAEKRTQIHCYAIFGDEEQPLGECRAYIHLYPAGGAGGTIADLAAFAKAFLCDSADCPLFQKADTLAEMLTPSLYYADGMPRNCHGLFVQEYGVNLVGHGGNTSGFSTLLQLDLAGKTGFVMMTNKAGDSIYKGLLPKRLYGEYAFAEADASGASCDVTGRYYSSGNPCAGPMKLYDFLTRSLIMKKDGEYYTDRTGSIRMLPLSDGLVRVELITGAVYPYHAETDSDGNVLRLQNKSADFVRISQSEILLNYLLLGLTVAAFGWMLVLLILHLLSFGKHKKEDTRMFRLFEIIMGVSALLAGADIGLACYWGMQSKGMIAFYCIALMVLEALMLACLLACHLTKTKPANKIGFVLEHIGSICIIAGTCYFGLYRFWGY